MRDRSGSLQHQQTRTILGIDLAWSARNPSGVVALQSLGPGEGWGVSGRWTVTSDDELLDLVALHTPPTHSDNPSADAAVAAPVLAIDAPLIAPNPGGTSRPADRELTRRFARFHAGAYPANQALCPRPLGLAAKLLQRGFSLDPAAALRNEPAAIEVFPHAAAIGLFGLERIFKYKKGPVDARRRELGRFQGLLRRELPRLPSAVEPPPDDSLDHLRGTALKQREDQLDAHLCGATAATFLARPGQFEVVGDLDQGYILVPRLDLSIR